MGWTELSLNPGRHQEFVGSGKGTAWVTPVLSRGCSPDPVMRNLCEEHLEEGKMLFVGT